MSYRYSSVDPRSNKKRRLDANRVEETFPTTIDYGSRKLPMKGSVSVPSAEVTLPMHILHSQTPQDLTYAILTSDKTIFTKQELLIILGKHDHMLQPKFSDSCEYIS